MQPRISRLFTRIHELNLWSKRCWSSFYTSKKNAEVKLLDQGHDKSVSKPEINALCHLWFSHQAGFLYWKCCTELRGKPCTQSDYFVQNVHSSSDCLTEVTLYFYLFVHLNFALVETLLSSVRAGIMWFLIRFFVNFWQSKTEAGSKIVWPPLHVRWLILQCHLNKQIQHVPGMAVI